MPWILNLNQWATYAEIAGRNNRWSKVMWFSAESVAIVSYTRSEPAELFNMKHAEDVMKVGSRTELITEKKKKEKKSMRPVVYFVQ